MRMRSREAGVVGRWACGTLGTVKVSHRGTLGTVNLSQGKLGTRWVV